MFSPVFHGTRASGTTPLAATIAKLFAAVSQFTGVCSSSTVSQSNPTRAIKRAATVSGNVSHVPMLGWPSFNFARTLFFLISVALGAQGI